MRFRQLETFGPRWPASSRRSAFAVASVGEFTRARLLALYTKIRSGSCLKRVGREGKWKDNSKDEFELRRKEGSGLFAKVASIVFSFTE